MTADPVLVTQRDLARTRAAARPPTIPLLVSDSTDDEITGPFVAAFVRGRRKNVARARICGRKQGPDDPGRPYDPRAVIRSRIAITAIARNGLRLSTYDSASARAWSSDQTVMG